MMLFMTKLLISLSFFAAAAASAQHDTHSPSHSPQSTASGYAGEEAREIKALSAQEQRAWLEGQGIGLAKAAELNSYPGPMHVLENANELKLSEAQKKGAQELMRRHKDEVRAMGLELVSAERRLDEVFKSRRATSVEVSGLTQQIGHLQARIRASHLITHIEQTAMLRPEQVAAYDKVRGYRR